MDQTQGRSPAAAEIHDITRPNSWAGQSEHWHIGPGDDLNHIPLVH